MHSTRRLPLIYGRNAQKRVMAKLASNPVRVPFALTEEKCAKHLFASMGHFPCEPSNTTFCTDYVGRLNQRAGSRGAEFQPTSALVRRDKIAQPRLIQRHFCTQQSIDFVVVRIDTRHLVTEAPLSGLRRPGQHSSSDHGNAHRCPSSKLLTVLGNHEYRARTIRTNSANVLGKLCKRINSISEKRRF